jgi:uncharacterized repeat protein (TIGR01451 family)
MWYNSTNWYIQATNTVVINTVYVASASQDTNSANNSATTNVTVRNPAVHIINAGAVLTDEKSPRNGAIDPGETVTVSLALANVGQLDTTNLVATLLVTNGVTSPIPSGPQPYGALIHGGPSAARSFTFTSGAPAGSAVVATLRLQDGTTNLGTVAYTFSVSATSNFLNSAAIIIPDHGVGSPYPSSINVSGMTGRVSKATVTLNGLSHTFPHDVNVMLVSPSGSNVLVMSHTGGGHSVINLTLTFDDAASGTLPNYNPITSGTYKPSSYEGPVALPGTSRFYSLALSGMIWSSPNGAWSLYVFDDKPGDAGIIAGGWSLNLTTLVTVGPVVDLAVGLSVPASLDVGGTLTNTISITNSGPDAATGVVLANPLATGVNFVSASLSQGSYLTSADGRQVTCNLGSLSAGGSAKVTILTTPSLAGSLVTSVSVAANEDDLNPANNTAQAATTVYGPASLSGAFSGGHFHLTVTARPSYVFLVQGSTNLTSWVSLSTNTNTTGTFTFIDATPPAPQQRFYRTKRLIP